MDGSKSFFASKTVWGGLVVIVVQVLTILGLDPAAIADTGEWLTNLITLIGAGIAIYGRLAATKRVEPPKVPGVTPLLLLALILPCVATLGSGCSPTAPYVAADRATYDAIAPEYTRYVDADPALSEDDKALRRSTVETWGLRLKHAQEPR